MATAASPCFCNQTCLGKRVKQNLALSLKRGCARSPAAANVQPCHKRRKSTARRRPACTATARTESTCKDSLSDDGGGAPRRRQEPISIVFATAEAAPWSKTGGLGDVLGSLPVALARRGHRVLVVTPRYFNQQTADRYADLEDTGVTFSLDLWEGGTHEVRAHHTQEQGVHWVFLEHACYNRLGDPYGDKAGPFHDNLFRFALLSLAACEATLRLRLPPDSSPLGEDVVFVANDWHTALLPVYLAARYRPRQLFSHARCVLALHNLAHQGCYDGDAFRQLGLPPAWRAKLEWMDPDNRWPQPRELNVLKAGVVAADELVSVSQAYAWEITTQPQPNGLHYLLSQHQHRLRGIVNGIDDVEWDPAADRHIHSCYRPGEMRGKALCKAALQRVMRLPHVSSMPLVGFIGRLDYQKGPDLVLQAIPYLASLDCQVVLLGTGAADYEAQVHAANEEFPYHFHGHVGFNTPLAHQIMAGCDILLMPSRFEPCGLNQLYAMRYGTVPVAHSTGGLRDTIDDVNAFAPDAGGTGWTFAPATVAAMMDAVASAVQLFTEHRPRWVQIQARGMSMDLGWGRAAAQYEAIFSQLSRAGMMTLEQARLQQPDVHDSRSHSSAFR